MSSDERSPISETVDCPRETEERYLPDEQADKNRCESWFPVTVDGLWGWIVVMACFFVQMLTIGSTFNFGVIYVELRGVFGQSESVTSWIGSIQSALLYFTGIVAGPMIEAFGGRVTGTIGAIISAVGFATSSLAPNIYVLYLTYGFITGFGNGLMYVTASIVIHYYFDRWRPLANGIAVTGSGVGTLTLALLIQWLINKLKWRLALVVEGSIMLIGVACAATYRTVATVKNDESERRPLLTNSPIPAEPTTITLPNPNDVEIAACCVKTRTFKPSVFGHLSLFKYPQFAMFCAGSVLFSFGYHIPYAYIPERAERVCGISTGDAATLVSVMGAAGIVSRLASGLAFANCCGADHQSGRARGSTMTRTLLYYVATSMPIIYGLASIFLFAMVDYASMVVYAVVIGAAGGCWASLYSVVIVDMMGVDHVADAVGLAMTSGSVGFLLAAPLAGWMIKATDGSFNTPFAVCGGLQVLGGIVFVFARCCSSRCQETAVTSYPVSRDHVKVTSTSSTDTCDNSDQSLECLHPANGVSAK